MALNSFYRSEALESRIQREPIDRLAEVTVPFDWLALLALAAACAAIVAWGALGTIERTLRADALIVVPDDRRAVVATTGGRVTEVLVGPGERVDEGEPLARLATPELDRRLAAARERERLILEELSRPGPDAGLRGMLIDARAEAATVTGMLEAGNVIVSPFAGEVTEHRLAPGTMVAAGEEVARIRVGAPAAPIAIASLPRARAASVQPGAPGRLRCEGTGDEAALEIRVADMSPPPMASLARLADAGTVLDPRGERMRLTLPHAAAVAEGDRCELHIVIEARTPLQLLLAAGGPD